jgi:hypothetical protein
VLQQAMTAVQLAMHGPSLVPVRLLQTRQQVANGTAASKKRAALDEGDDKAPAPSPTKRFKTGTHWWLDLQLVGLILCATTSCQHTN